MADPKGDYKKLQDEAADEKLTLIEQLSQKLANNIENGLARGTLTKGFADAPKDYRPPSRADFEREMWSDLRKAKKFGDPDSYKEE